ncbi:MAG: GxxExxY protein, partial [Saprospiraceae bacterium]
CLSYELRKNGLAVEEEKPMPVIYDDIRLNQGYRLDLLVENTVVIELKTAEAFTEVHQAQILTYMRLGGFPLGLLMNFYVSALKNGIKRFVIN